MQAVALVTGGAGGIGKSICEFLAEDGHAVVVADLEVSSAKRVAEEIGGLGVSLDVCSPGSISDALAAVTAWRGSPTIVVNCAGWDEFMPFHDTGEEVQAKIMDINLAGPIRVTRATLPGMMKAGTGRFVNIASEAGRLGSAMEAIYSAAKGGVIAFTKSIAREYARHGISANSVCPGPTDTALMRQMAADQGDVGERLLEGMVRAIPMRRLGESTDIAGIVAFLASPKAAFITGQTVSVSGGLSMS
jgi:2-hydroxycyclohexanecarboxyl-CoA dehydrogenase